MDSSLNISTMIFKRQAGEINLYFSSKCEQHELLAPRDLKRFMSSIFPSWGNDAAKTFLKVPCLMNAAYDLSGGKRCW